VGGGGEGVEGGGLGVAGGGRGERGGAAELIFERFLATHALVGLAELLDRYPFEEDGARRQLEAWARTGRVVPVRRGELEPVQWSAPANLEQVQRGSLALLRREVVTCAPPQFADF